MTGIRIGTHPLIATGAYARRLAGGAFSRALAGSDSPQAFLRSVGGWVPDGARFGPAQHRALKDWLRKAAPKGHAAFVLDAAPFAGLEGGLPPEELLHLAIGYGLAWVYRLPDTLLPCLQALAPSAAEEHGPGRITYAPAPAGRPFARPFLLDDMEVWLRALRTAPAPVLSDGWSVPAARQRAVAKGFVPLPGFLPASGFSGEERARAAWWMIAKLDLTAPAGGRRKGTRLGLSPAGEAWLAAQRRERLTAVLDWVPLGERARADGSEILAFLGEAEGGGLPYRAATATVFAWLKAACAGVRAPVDFEAFLESAAERANPFLFDAAKDAGLAGRWGTWRTPPEDAYRHLLARYAARLASLGALGFGAGTKGNLAVTQTAIGDWLFRRAGAWALPDPARDAWVVGADFTVTLLAPDADARIDLAAFAEPAGEGYRITREAVQRAAQGGLRAADMLAVLRARGKHALPANVAHEIEGWAGSRKTVRMGDAILIEGEDPVVLAELMAAFPKDFAAIAPTALRYVGKGTRAALAKRLARKGFFA